jgi:mono/diheme cytochrome c family protein
VKSNLMRIAFLSIVTVLVTPAFAQSGGADVYKAKCVMCHGTDGVGATSAGKALKAASFKDSSIVNASDADLIAAATKGKGKMPANQGKLTDAQIKAVIAYVRTLQK